MLADDLLPGARAAATFLGVTKRTVYHMAADGRVPAVKIGGKLYFRKSELERTFSTAPSSRHDEGSVL